MTRKLFLILFISISSFAFGQVDSTERWFIRATPHYGVLLPEYGFQRYQVNQAVSGFEFNFARQFSGKNIWEQIYRYPQFGLSLFFSTLGNKSIYGNQFTLFPYYALHIVQRKNFVFSYQLGVGVSYATKKFDPENNFENVSMGSHFNIHFQTDFSVRYRLYRNYWITGGLSFNHISNANLSEPNVGLNYSTLFAGLSMTTGKKEERKKTELAPYSPENSWLVTLNGGMKHSRTFETFKYPAVGLSFDFRHRRRYKFALSLGADIFYDSSTEAQMKRMNKEYKSSYSYTSGIHLSEEFIYGPLSLIIQEGIYLGLSEHIQGYTMYNRAIARFRIGEHFMVSGSMKSHLVVLDFPEIGIGYTWK